MRIEVWGFQHFQSQDFSTKGMKIPVFGISEAERDLEVVTLCARNCNQIRVECDVSRLAVNQLVARLQKAPAFCRTGSDRFF